MVQKSVPKATLQRYPVYLKALRKLKRNGIERIMSKELASVVNIDVIFLFSAIWGNRAMAMMSIC